MAFKPTKLTDVGMKKTVAVEGHAPSWLPNDKKWRLVWNDEFDLDHLDSDKWNYRLCYWGYPSPTFTTEGV